MLLKPGESVYFLSLELENVGAFGPEGAFLNLSDGHGQYARWTLILGENGIGKTTALECLLGLTPLPVDTSPFKGPGIHALTWLLNGHLDKLTRVTTLEPLRIGATIAPIASDSSEETLDRIELKMRRNPDTGEVHELSVTTPFKDPSRRPGSPIISYRAARDIDVESSTFPELPVGKQRSHPDNSIRVFVPISVDEWLLQLHHTKMTRDPGWESSEFNEVRALLIDVLPGVLDIRSTTPRERRDTVRMEYLTEDGWMPYSNLGLGYKSVIGLVGDLAYRLYSAYPDAERPLEGPAVVLIDEIDLHLHAKWQRDLISVLTARFPNTQFIATAHSPLMVQAAAGHNLVLLRRDPATKQVRADNDLDAIANWRLDQIITSELFGIPSARPPSYDADVARRTELLAKSELTSEDRSEIRRIEASLGDVPMSVTPGLMRTEELLKQTLAALEKKAAG
jgi:energy-coupling factor transporter ATP-binding protein EcfA2